MIDPTDERPAPASVTTDPRAPAQPMDQDRRDSVRLDIEGGWRPAQDDAAALLGDRDHWRAMYRTGLEAYGDAHADIERLEADRDRLAAEVKHLRAAVDPALRDRCQCCRRCGPSIPCDVVIETLGDNCAGACFCGAGS